MLWVNVFGNPVDISTATTPKKDGVPAWASLSHAGSIPATQWLHDHGSLPDIDVAITTVAPAPPYNQIVIEQDKVGPRAQVAARISPAEGGMDSVQAQDAGIVSFGMQQWAAHVENELTVLFERFRAQAPDHYDLFFGSAGLQTKRWVNNYDPTKYPPAPDTIGPPDPSANEVNDWNPYGPDLSNLNLDPFDPAGPPSKLLSYFPLYVTFVQVEPGSRGVNIPAPQKNPKRYLLERKIFLSMNRKDRDWCGRARLAGLMSHEYKRAQIHQAAWRFTRIEHEASTDNFTAAAPGTPFAVPIATLSAVVAADINVTSIDLNGVNFSPISRNFRLKCGSEIMQCTGLNGSTLTVQRAQQGTAPAKHNPADMVYHLVGYAELFSSEFAAGAVLDIHINFPVNALGGVAPAIQRTPGDTHAPGGDLADVWLRRFAINYLATRSLFPTYWKAENQRARNNDLILLHDQAPSAAGIAVGLSPDPGTFKAWERSS